MPNHILLIDTQDRKGLMHDVTGVLFRQGCNIESNGEFVDKEAGRFFMRTEISGDADLEAIGKEIRTYLPEEGNLRIVEARKQEVVILVTKEAHCIGDLLIRHQFGQLNATIKAVVGNHRLLGSLVEKFDLPFHFVDHEGISREEHEKKIAEIVDGYAPDYLVLAKFMRILTPGFVERYANRIVNIHHSFLPAFIGANPYRQAYERGVKIIGATAHFVNNNLDEGPIIAQDVIPVSHVHDHREMASAGQGAEDGLRRTGDRPRQQDHHFRGIVR